MPKIEFEGKTIECASGDNLRDVLLANGSNPHNGPARALNCRGNSLCGTCAVRVTGPVSELAGRERFRMSLPPHKLERGLRLACQCRVEGDLQVVKYQGFWGQRTDKVRAATD